jgi:hypothetical protein
MRGIFVRLMTPGRVRGIADERTAMRLMGYQPDFVAKYIGALRTKVGEANYDHNRPSRGP